MEIPRTKALKELNRKLKDFPIVAILGPRQCGKTTLAHQFAASRPNRRVHFFDLEDPRDLARLENPTLTLEPLTGFIVIDEIQHMPELFPVLRVLADTKTDAKFLILGSASPRLMKRSSETLAGRVAFLELGGFSLDILKPQNSCSFFIFISL